MATELELRELQQSAFTGLRNISSRENFGVPSLPALTSEALKDVKPEQLQKDMQEAIMSASNPFLQGANANQALDAAMANGNENIQDLNALYDVVAQLKPEVEEYVKKKTAEDADANKARARQRHIFQVLRNASINKLLVDKYLNSVEAEEDEEKALLQKDINNMAKAIHKEFETRDGQNSHAGLHAQLGKNFHMLIERPMVNLLSRAAGLGNVMPQGEFDDKKKGDGMKFMPMG